MFVSIRLAGLVLLTGFSLVAPGCTPGEEEVGLNPISESRIQQVAELPDQTLYWLGRNYEGEELTRLSENGAIQYGNDICTTVGEYSCGAEHGGLYQHPICGPGAARPKSELDEGDVVIDGPGRSIAFANPDYGYVTVQTDHMEIVIGWKGYEESLAALGDLTLLPTDQPAKFPPPCVGTPASEAPALRKCLKQEDFTVSAPHRDTKRGALELEYTHPRGDHGLLALTDNLKEALTWMKALRKRAMNSGGFVNHFGSIAFAWVDRPTAGSRKAMAPCIATVAH